MFKYGYKDASQTKPVSVDNQVRELFQKGLNLQNSGKYKEALECYERILKIDPRSVNALIEKASVLDILGKRKDAISYYDKALEFEPSNIDALYNKGVTLGGMGSFEDALLCYDEVLEHNPDNLGALINKGNALYRIGKHKEAIYCHDKASLRDLNSKEVPINRTHLPSIVDSYFRKCEMQGSWAIENMSEPIGPPIPDTFKTYKATDDASCKVDFVTPDRRKRKLKFKQGAIVVITPIMIRCNGSDISEELDLTET